MIIAAQGYIQEQNTHIIVNSTNSTFEWEDTTINGDILRKAGRGLESLFEQFRNEGKTLNVGDLVITPGYNCPCTLILHVMFPYAGYSSDEITEGAIDYVLEQIFDTAVMTGLDSISIPALGTGTFMLPPELVFQKILSVAKRYDHKFKEIRFVVNEPWKVDLFKSYMTKML